MITFQISASRPISPPRTGSNGSSRFHPPTGLQGSVPQRDSHDPVSPRLPQASLSACRNLRGGCTGRRTDWPLYRPSRFGSGVRDPDHYRQIAGRLVDATKRAEESIYHCVDLPKRRQSPAGEKHPSIQSTWENPSPGETVSTVDFLANRNSPASFLESGGLGPTPKSWRDSWRDDKPLPTSGKVWFC